MKNKLRRDIFVIIFLLLVACIALAVPLAFSNPRWLLAPALLVVFALVVAVLGIRRLRRFVADMLCGTNFEGSKTQYSLADFSIPTALITEGSVVWYNPAFREQILAGQDALLAAPDRLMTGIDLSVCARAHGQDLTIDETATRPMPQPAAAAKRAHCCFWSTIRSTKTRWMNTLPAVRLT